MRYSSVEEICVRAFDVENGKFTLPFHCYGMMADVLGALVDAGERGVVVDANDSWFTSSLNLLPPDFRIVLSPVTDGERGGNLIRYVLLGDTHIIICKRANEFFQGRYVERLQTNHDSQSTWSPFRRRKR